MAVLTTAVAAGRLSAGWNQFAGEACQAAIGALRRWSWELYIRLVNCQESRHWRLMRSSITQIHQLVDAVCSSIVCGMLSARGLSSSVRSCSGNSAYTVFIKSNLFISGTWPIEHKNRFVYSFIAFFVYNYLLITSSFFY